MGMVTNQVRSGVLNMKSVFSMVGLVVVLAVVGALVKRQMAALPTTQSTLSGSTQPATGVSGSGSTAPATTPRNQVNQVKEQMDQLMQQPRTMPEKE
jgi:hypothetical protein